MPESLKTKLWRRAFNFFPAYRGTGGRIEYVSDDYAEIHVRIPLSWRTRNYVGTIFGGSLYGAVDPVYMLMLIKLLGRDYVVWDKAATIRFKRPGRTTLRARFVVTPSEVAEIKAELAGRKSIDRVYTVELVDDAGKLHAQVEKTIYIARRERAEARRSEASKTVEEVAAP
jgi:acyl-coenzyme A thioesterase PaaI-like protein